MKLLNKSSVEPSLYIYHPSMVRINITHLYKLNSNLQQVLATVKLLDITDQSANEKKNLFIYLLILLLLLLLLLLFSF